MNNLYKSITLLWTQGMKEVLSALSILDSAIHKPLHSGFCFCFHLELIFSLFTEFPIPASSSSCIAAQRLLQLITKRTYWILQILSFLGFQNTMEITSTHNGSSSMMWFFKDRGFDDKSIQGMFRRCRRLEGARQERASENWAYLKSIGIQERKLPSIISKCPKILMLGLNEKIVPMVQCLMTLGTKPHEVASAIAKFPHILSHSVEEKLCPLLAFFQAFGIPEKQLGKMILLNPRLVSYSIETKLTEIVDFLASLGLNKDGMIGKVLARNPFIMGYSVDKRLRPTSEFLKSIGLTELDLQVVVVNFPEVLSRDVNKVFVPNYAYLRKCGFQDQQIVSLVVGFPPILIKSIQNSLEPRIRYLVDVMGRQIDEVVDCPCFFRHGLKKTLEVRYKLLQKRNLNCSLSEMLECNKKKFFMKFGLFEGYALSN